MDPIEAVAEMEWAVGFGDKKLKWVLVKEVDMEGSGEISLEKACLVGVEERIVLVEESGGGFRLLKPILETLSQSDQAFFGYWFY